MLKWSIATASGEAARAADDFGEFADVARQFGMRIGYEALAGGRHVRDWMTAWPVASLSRLLRSPNGELRITLNIGEGGATGASRFLDAFGGAGFQQIALSTHDIFGAVERALAEGVEFLPIPDNYYDDLATRFDIAPDLLARMRALGVLYDRAGEGEFLHIYSRTFDNRFFFEILERWSYDLFGAAKMPMRLAAQASVDNDDARAAMAFE